MPATATATREEARRQASNLIAPSNKHLERDGKVALEPSEDEIEALRFLINGLVDVRQM